MKTATQQDANSVNIQPVLLDINKGLELGSYNGLSCLRINGVNADIRNNVRDSMLIWVATNLIIGYGCFSRDNSFILINTLQPVYISGKIKKLGLNTHKCNLKFIVNGTITQSNSLDRLA